MVSPLRKVHIVNHREERVWAITHTGLLGRHSATVRVEVTRQAKRGRQPFWDVVGKQPS